MHECPVCGQGCTCKGDIDDINFGPFIGCVCECDEGDGEDWMYDHTPESERQ